MEEKEESLNCAAKPKLFYHYLNQILPDDIVLQIIFFKEDIISSVINDDLSSFYMLSNYYKKKDLYFFFKTLKKKELGRIIVKNNSINIMRFLNYFKYRIV